MPVDPADVGEERPGMLVHLRNLPWNLPAAECRKIARAKEDELVQIHRERIQRYVAPKVQSAGGNNQ